jgi:hypothetical protein
MRRPTTELRPRVLAALASTLLIACLADDSPAETDTDPDGGTVTTGPTPGTMTNPVPVTDTDGAETTLDPGTETTLDPGADTTTTGADTTTTGEDATTTGDPGESCFDWMAPRGPCEPRGAASATAYANDDILPELDEAPCTIASIEPGMPDADLVTIDCGEPIVIEIRSSSPHLELPLVAGQDVLVSAHAGESYWVTSESPSFVIRSTEGELLVAWVNPIDGYGQLGAEVDVDIAPLSLSVSGSGCAAVYDPASPEFECSNEGGEGTTAIQPGYVEVANGEEPLQLFGGSDASVGEVALVVDTVDLIVCRDPACGDDSGPFSRLSLLAVAIPGG